MSASRSAWVLAGVLGACALHAPAARAAEPRPHELTNTGPGFLALESLGTLAVFGVVSVATGDTPAACKWCEPTGLDDAVRGALRMSSPRAPALASHVLSVGVLPVGGFVTLLVPALSADSGSLAWKDAWIMANAFLLSTALADGTKKLAARQRPAFHYGLQAETEARSHPGEENLSFFSGDTAWAFSFASSAATLAFLHGYRVAPYLAIGGGVLAAAAGVLRIAADMHWVTDVVAGAVVGTAVGIGLPLVLHRREVAPAVTVAPLSGPAQGASVSGVF